MNCCSGMLVYMGPRLASSATDTAGPVAQDKAALLLGRGSLEDQEDL